MTPPHYEPFSSSSTVVKTIFSYSPTNDYPTTSLRFRNYFHEEKYLFT